MVCSGEFIPNPPGLLSFTCGWNSNAQPGGCQTPVDPAPDDVNFANVVRTIGEGYGIRAGCTMPGAWRSLVAQVLDWMAENLCVDMDRVFITGFSNGGQRGMLPQGGLKFTGLTQNLGQL